MLSAICNQCKVRNIQKYSNRWLNPILTESYSECRMIFAAQKFVNQGAHNPTAQAGNAFNQGLTGINQSLNATGNTNNTTTGKWNFQHVHSIPIVVGMLLFARINAHINCSHLL